MSKKDVIRTLVGAARSASVFISGLMGPDQRRARSNIIHVTGHA